MALTASVDTRAKVMSMNEDIITLDVASLGAKDPAYQWRIDDGPWRRLRTAPHGKLTIKEPRFRLDIPQDLYVRSIDLARQNSLDYSPSRIAVPGLKARRDMLIHSQNSLASASGGCDVSSTGYNSSMWFVVLLLCMRRNRRKLGLLGVFLCVLVSSFGCSNDEPSEDLTCSRDQNCPAGRVCIDERCELSRPCENDGACCGSEVCRENICEQRPTDGCTLSSVPCETHEIASTTYISQPCEIIRTVNPVHPA